MAIDEPVALNKIRLTGFPQQQMVERQERMSKSADRQLQRIVQKLDRSYRWQSQRQ